MMHYLLQCSYIIKPYKNAVSPGSLAPLFVTSVVLLFYLFAFFRLHQHKKHWSFWRIFSFTAGCILLLIACGPAIMMYAHSSFSGHMLQHLLIGMLAPVGLVMGAPVTLALKVLPLRIAKSITAILGSRVFHIISHPITALLLNMGGMFGLYLTPLYNVIAYRPALHWLMHLHFLLAGYLFTWAIIGPDPAPKRPDLQLRLLVLFISMASHAYLSKMMYAYVYPRTLLYSADGIQYGAKLMYYGGDVAELMLVIILFTIWYSKNKQPKYRIALLTD